MTKIEKLREQVILHSELQAELDKIGTAEKDTAKEIAEGAKFGNHLSGDEVDKLGRAHLRKQMIPERKKELKAMVERMGERTREAWVTARRQFDNYVLIQKEKVFQEFLNTVEPFFGGPEKARLTRREFENSHVPGRDELNRCFSQDFFDVHATAETYLTFAKLFLEHVARVCQNRGWKEEDIEKSSRFLDPESDALAHHTNTAGDPVVARAKEAVSVDGKMVREGQLCRITTHQYRALARFFTKIEGKVTSAMEGEIAATDKQEPEKKPKKSFW